MRLSIPGIFFVEDLQREKALMLYISRNIVRSGLLPIVIQGGASLLAQSTLRRSRDAIVRRAIRDELIEATKGKWTPYEQQSEEGLCYTTCQFTELLYYLESATSVISQAHAYQANVINHEFF